MSACARCGQYGGYLYTSGCSFCEGAGTVTVTTVTRSYIACPFCGEDDFDLYGLKLHLFGIGQQPCAAVQAVQP